MISVYVVDTMPENCSFLLFVGLKINFNEKSLYSITFPSSPLPNELRFGALFRIPNQWQITKNVSNFFAFLFRKRKQFYFGELKYFFNKSPNVC